MPPIVAALLTLGGIVLLLRRDQARNADVSAALWLPVMWLFVTGSRFVSQWMDLGGGPEVSYYDGSPVDAAYFLALICAGLLVLMRRSVSLGELIRQNLWLALAVGLGLVSVIWSDEPVIAFKRWIKALGHPVMALVILTDPNPVAALRTVLKRCAFLLLPLSALFIKYFPEYGRGFDSWTGEVSNTGVGLTKNDLGYVCVSLGLFLFWHLLTARSGADGRRNREETWTSLALLALALWLWSMSNSTTSLVMMLIGSATIAGLGSQFVSKRYFGTLLIVVLVIGVTMEYVFDVYALVLELLGKSPTLTDRTLVWADALALQDRPILGFGFESYWLGPRLELLWEKWWWKPNQAHNGYIETYLNLGIVGVALLFLVIVSTFRKIAASFDTDFDFARLRMGLLLAILAFNVSEAAFKGVHFIWTLFFIIALDYARSESTQSSPSRSHGTAQAL
jgi:exopolysaccharide production protein ExoQ